MATQPKTFFTTASQSAFPRMEPVYITRAEFASGTGTYAKGTAVAWNSSDGLWRVWDGDGTAEDAKIDGFVWIEHSIHASGETIGAVMTSGEVHYDDILQINTVDASYGSAAELQGDLKTMIFRDKNLRVVGLTGTPE